MLHYCIFYATILKIQVTDLFIEKLLIVYRSALVRNWERNLNG